MKNKSVCLSKDSMKPIFLHFSIIRSINIPKADSNL